MGLKSNSQKTVKLTFNGSGGIDTRMTYGKPPGIEEITNFRIMPDGSLKKRCGYKKILSTQKSIRDIWSGIINSRFVCFMLADDYVYKVDVETGKLTFCSRIKTTSGRAQFFYFRDNLYLVDGTYIYRITEGSATISTGYVPLLGKDWPTGTAGEIYEPLNILHSRARITYKAGSSPTPYLPTLYAVDSVQAIYKNGSLLPLSEFRYDASNKLICLNSISSGDIFEINVTFVEENPSPKSKILSCTSASVIGETSNSRLFLWNGSNSNTIYPSSYVSNESVEKSNEGYPESGHLYFRRGDEFVIGDGRYNVMAIARHYDRPLIFTEGDTWMADSSAFGIKDLPLKSVNTAVGAYSHNGVINVGDEPISVGMHGIFKWTSDTDGLNESNACCISDPIRSFLLPEFFKYNIVFYDRVHKEIWFHEEERDGYVWIYNLEHKAWINFRTIFATNFFDANGNVGFTDENAVYVFDENLDQDSYSTSYTNISASIKSGVYEFDYAEYKKISSVVCRCDLQNSSVGLTLKTDRGESIPITFSGSANHAVIRRRITSHRMKGFEFTLVDNSKYRPTIHSIEFEAR